MCSVGGGWKGGYYGKGFKMSILINVLLIIASYLYHNSPLDWEVLMSLNKGGKYLI